MLNSASGQMLCALTHLKLHPALDRSATVGLLHQQVCLLSPVINSRNEIKDFKAISGNAAAFTKIVCHERVLFGVSEAAQTQLMECFRK